MADCAVEERDDLCLLAYEVMDALQRGSEEQAKLERFTLRRLGVF